ncbi:MAG: cobalt transporter CbiM [Cyanobacteria bacterium SBLK]|nr:cobalt transporter CbiM [Cyanobacteria bacterium SBLK]
MHVPDGLLPHFVCLGGYALMGGLTHYSLRQIQRDKNAPENMPKASLLAAAFFVASLIHIPIPPISVHLVLCGLMGAILGYYSFPAILIGLFFQAVMFQHGGLSTLGVNSLIFGIPAIASHHFFSIGKKLTGNNLLARKFLAFLTGFGGTALAAFFFAVIIALNIPADLDVRAERTAILAFFISHLVLAAIEGVFMVMILAFLERVKPELLQGNG